MYVFVCIASFDLKSYNIYCFISLKQRDSHETIVVQMFSFTVSNNLEERILPQPM